MSVIASFTFSSIMMKQTALLKTSRVIDFQNQRAFNAQARNVCLYMHLLLLPVTCLLAVGWDLPAAACVSCLDLMWSRPFMDNPVGHCLL